MTQNPVIDDLRERAQELPTIDELYEQTTSLLTRAEPERTPKFKRRPNTTTQRWADVTSGSYMLGLEALGHRYLGTYEDHYQHLQAALGNASGADPDRYAIEPNLDACEQILALLANLEATIKQIATTIDAVTDAAQADLQALREAQARTAGDA